MSSRIPSYVNNYYQATKKRTITEQEMPKETMQKEVIRSSCDEQTYWFSLSYMQFCSGAIGASQEMTS